MLQMLEWRDMSGTQYRGSPLASFVLTGTLFVKIWAPSLQPAACGGSLRAILPLHSSKKFANYLQHMKHFPSSKYSNLLRELHGKCSPASLVATFLYVENVFSMWMVTSGYNWVEAATERERQGRWHILAGLQPSSQTAFYNNGQDLRILSYGWIKVDCLFATVAGSLAHFCT